MSLRFGFHLVGLVLLWVATTALLNALIVPLSMVGLEPPALADPRL
jgi:hypothetical protein